MGCCEVLIKYIVFLFNFVFFLTSVALIGIGAYIQINMTKVILYEDVLKSGAAAALMQGVNLHPSISSNGCIAPVLRKKCFEIVFGLSEKGGFCV